MILKLHRQGVSVRQLGIHRNTAHAHRRRADCGQLQNPAAVQTSFRFFRDLLTGSLAACSGLTGRRVNNGDRLCQMAPQKGAMILTSNRGFAERGEISLRRRFEMCRQDPPLTPQSARAYEGVHSALVDQVGGFPAAESAFRSRSRSRLCRRPRA